MEMEGNTNIVLDFIIDIMKSMHKNDKCWEVEKDPTIYEYYKGYIDPETGILYDTDKWEGMDSEERSLYYIGDAKILESVFTDAIKHARKGKWIYDTLSEVREKEGQEEKFELRVPLESPYGWIMEVTNLLSEGLLYVGFKDNPEDEEISHTWILETWDYDHLYDNIRKYGILTNSLKKERDEFVDRVSSLIGEKDLSFIYWLYPVYIANEYEMSDDRILNEWEGFLSGGVYFPE